jgi:hypothetical protein
MTYGFVPGNWPAFQRELEHRGLAVDDIEKVEIRPSDDAPEKAMIDVVVTARSGAVHVWRHDEAPPPA